MIHLSDNQDNAGKNEILLIKRPPERIKKLVDKKEKKNTFYLPSSQDFYTCKALSISDLLREMYMYASVCVWFGLVWFGLV